MRLWWIALGRGITRPCAGREALPPGSTAGMRGWRTSHVWWRKRWSAGRRLRPVRERLPAACRRLGIEWPAGVANRVRRGWGMVYAAEMRGRLLARVADRELARGDYRVVNAQEVYSVPHLRRVADRHRVPLVLTLHGYPLYE